jgi:hypothetical protein
VRLDAARRSACATLTVQRRGGLDGGFWALEEKSTGAFAGELGFAEFRREIEPLVLGIPEVGYKEFQRTTYKNQATIIFERTGVE